MMRNHLNKTFEASTFGLYHRASAILEFFCRIKWAMISIVLLSTSDRLKPHLTECNFGDQSNPHCTHRFHQCLNGRDDLMCPEMGMIPNSTFLLVNGHKSKKDMIGKSSAMKGGGAIS